MSASRAVPLVRCRLDGGADHDLRYIPAAEFGLWQHLMETRHRRQVDVEAVSVWIPDGEPAPAEASADDLQPVLRVMLELPGPCGVPIPVERYFPAENYPQALQALLAHYDTVPTLSAIKTVPGYFVPLAAVDVDRIRVRSGRSLLL